MSECGVTLDTFVMRAYPSGHNTVINVGLGLAQRRRRWANTKSTLNLILAHWDGGVIYTFMVPTFAHSGWSEGGLLGIHCSGFFGNLTISGSRRCLFLQRRWHAAYGDAFIFFMEITTFTSGWWRCSSFHLSSVRTSSSYHALPLLTVLGIQHELSNYKPSFNHKLSIYVCFVVFIFYLFYYELNLINFLEKVLLWQTCTISPVLGYSH